MEIERKFLVSGDYRPLVTTSISVVQGYLSSAPERCVRVRISGDRGFITIKGLGNETGATRFEWEREIPVDEARDLLQLCEPGVIEKTRRLVPCGNLIFEVDEFHGANEGLVLAEIELLDEAQDFERPAWLGEEVTGQPKYYNASLMKHPFQSWWNAPS